MVLFAQELGPAAAVFCVSNDQGFGPALERCGRQGAFTVAGEAGKGVRPGRGRRLAGWLCSCADLRLWLASRSAACSCRIHIWAGRVCLLAIKLQDSRT
jgi:hypothetical protein